MVLMANQSSKRMKKNFLRRSKILMLSIKVMISMLEINLLTMVRVTC